MYVSSAAPIPQNSMTPMSAAQSAWYNAHKMRIFREVAWAASRFACTSPVDSSSFSGFGLNFQYQVQRAAGLVNDAGSALSKAATAAASSSTTSGTAPQVIPLNPVQTNPAAPDNVPSLGPWDTPRWGNAATARPPSCAPAGQDLLAMIQMHPWWALGAAAAVLLAGGVLTTAGVKRYRRRRR